MIVLVDDDGKKDCELTDFGVRIILIQLMIGVPVIMVTHGKILW